MKLRYLVMVLFTFYYSSLLTKDNVALNEFEPPTQEMPIYKKKVIEAGYDFQDHKIRTEDGYILTAWRIQKKEYSTNETITRKKPIILQHGLCDSSYSWLVLDKEHALPFLLAEKGYDVWITNTRGNTFSIEHENETKFNSNDMYSKYWDFSFHEMALYDLPAMINYIKLISGFEKVSYICHSQGSLIYFILYTINPSFLNANIDKLFTLGTVINIFTTSSQMIKLTSRFYVSSILDRLHIKNIMCFHNKIYQIIQKFCATFNTICYNIINFIVANSQVTHRMNLKEFFDEFFFIPAGTSAKNVRHWIQIYRKQQLAPFDYGKKKNKKIYNRLTPPPYNISQFMNYNITSYLFTSDMDPFSNQDDLNYLLKYLFNKQNVKIINMENYNHLDFLWSKDATIDIYSRILSILDE